MFNTKATWNRVSRRAAALVCAAILGIALTPNAAADEVDKKTVVTFSAPVEIPGKVLPPGTYVFKVLDTSGGRNIVQVFDKDEKQLYATLLAVPDYRLKAPDKPLIKFEERASNAPEAIKGWFYPGDNYGWEFVYPNDRAVEIAKQHKRGVPSMSSNMTKNINNTQSTSANDPSVQEMKNTEVTGVNSSGDPVALGDVVLMNPQK
jgi:hypothetical protein